MNDDEKAIRQCFYDFSTAMHQWEDNAYSFNKAGKEQTVIDEWKSQTRKIKSDILEQFLTKRKRAYSEYLSFGWPSKFNPDLETILSIEIIKSQANVHTEKKHPEGAYTEKRLFKFKKAGGVWLLDNVKLWSEYIRQQVGVVYHMTSYELIRPLKRKSQDELNLLIKYRQ